MPGQGIAKVQNPNTGCIDVFTVDTSGYVHQHYWCPGGSWGESIIASGALAGAGIEAFWVYDNTILEFWTPATSGNILHGWFNGSWNIELHG